FHLGARKRLKVCAAAVVALASSRSPQAVEILRRLTGDADPSVRMAATKALSSLVVIEDDATVLSWADAASEQVRQARTGVLGSRRDPRSLEMLRALADGPSALVRASALAALGNFGDSRVLNRLMSGLEDEAWQVQWGAASGLEAMAQ